MSNNMEPIEDVLKLWKKNALSSNRTMPEIFVTIEFLVNLIDLKNRNNAALVLKAQLDKWEKMNGRTKDN